MRLSRHIPSAFEPNSALGNGTTESSTSKVNRLALELIAGQKKRLDSDT